MADLHAISEFWDGAAPTFDESADHGLREPATRAAWAALLREWIPDPGRVLDLGCGTGSLSVLVARQGHRVVGVDVSARMVGLAREKAAGLAAEFVVGDAADPDVTGEFDVVMVRHLLWTLPDPGAALRAWCTKLVGGGRLVLVEGRWAGTVGESYVVGADSFPWYGGVTAADLVAEVRPLVDSVTVHPLTDPVLWGRPVTDERYALVARVHDMA